MTGLPPAERSRLDALAARLDRHSNFVQGDAWGTIHYTARGTTVDWLYHDHNISAFVLESRNLCGEHWCWPEAAGWKGKAALTAGVQVALALVTEIRTEMRPYVVASHSVLPAVVFAIFACIMCGLSACYRRSEKDLSHELEKGTSIGVQLE